MIRHKRFMLGLGIFLIACNLRPAITSVGPLVDRIQVALSIPGFALGMITALPLLAFSVVSPLIPSISVRLGNERTIFWGMILLISGIAIRSSGSVLALYLGTLLLGIGITAGNVLIPAVIKDRMTTYTGVMTSIYSTSLSFAAGIASGISVPLAVGLAWGWEFSLLFWSIPAILATVFWFPQLRHSHGRKDINQTATETITPINSDLGIWKSPTAWYVALFMGFQSLLYFTLVTWLPTILQEQGTTISFAGWMVAYFQFIGLPFSLLMPVIAVRMHDQRIIAFLSGLAYTFGILGLLLGGGTAWLITSVSLMGIGGSSSVSLAITFMNLRAKDSLQAAKLSGMSQAVGYLLAMVGPIVLGTIADYGNIGVAGILFMVTAGVALMVFGYLSGRNKLVS